MSIITNEQLFDNLVGALQRGDQINNLLNKVIEEKGPSAEELTKASLQKIKDEKIPQLEDLQYTLESLSLS